MSWVSPSRSSPSIACIMCIPVSAMPWQSRLAGAVVQRESVKSHPFALQITLPAGRDTVNVEVGMRHSHALWCYGAFDAWLWCSRAAAVE